MNSASPRLTADDLKASIDIVEFIRSHGVELRPAGAEFNACCPFHDERTPSFTVTPAKQFYHCFGCGASGTVIDFAQQWNKSSLADAIRNCERYLGGSAAASDAPVKQKTERKAKADDWQLVIPVPDDAPPPPDAYFKNSVSRPIVARWAYRDADGGLIGYVNRYEIPKDDGSVGKEVAPCVFSLHAVTGRTKWTWKAFPKPRPLYGLPDLAARPGAQVLVVEGEKTRDAAQRLLPGLVVVTWPGGSKAAKHADWSPLEGRKVVLWPDRDAPGVAAMEGHIDQRHNIDPGVLQLLDGVAAGVRVVDPPAGDDEGWDLADGEASGWTTDDVMAHIRAAMRDPRPPVIDEPEPPSNDNYPPADYYGYEPPLEFGYMPPENDAEPFRCLGYGPGPVYYYMPNGTQLVTDLTPNGHNSLNMLALAPLYWWERRYAMGDKMKAETWRFAANVMMQECHKKGLFDQDVIRGRGAWWDAGRSAIHLGTAVVIDGNTYSLDKVPSEYVYQRGKRLAVHTENPLHRGESRLLIDICERLTWEKPVNGKLLAGWILLAPICGALRWRPHIWVTGPAGSGKSTVMSLIVNKAMGDMAMFVQSATTEAGLRQAIGSDAIPVVFDEAESESEKRERQIDGIMELVTQSSSDTGARIVKGSAGGTAMAYNIRSMFAFSSIGIGIKQFAAKTRITTLGLLSNQASAESQEHYEEILREINDVLTEEYVCRLHARAIKMIPVIRKNMETFARAASIKLKTTRLGDQIGALLAGAYALHSDNEITREAAEKWIAEQDWSEVSQVNDDSDESLCLRQITQSILEIETPHQKVKRTIAEIISLATERTSMSGVLRDDAHALLNRHGLRVMAVDELPDRPTMLLVANRNVQLGHIFKGTKWAVDWRGTLARLPGAIKHEQVRFGTGKNETQRCVAIPLSVVFGEREG